MFALGQVSVFCVFQGVFYFVSFMFGFQYQCSQLPGKTRLQMTYYVLNPANLTRAMKRPVAANEFGIAWAPLWQVQISNHIISNSLFCMAAISWIKTCNNTISIKLAKTGGQKVKVTAGSESKTLWIPYLKKPMKRISPNFGRRWNWVHRCAD